MSTESLPEYRVKARNTAAASENKIHDDAVARRHGFPGGLVPGVTVYAYLTHPLVSALGTAWLERGTATVRLVKPILDGEEVSVTGQIAARDPRELSLTMSAQTAARGECAVLTATLPAGLATPVNVARYQTAPLPTERPPVTREYLESVSVLGTPVTLYDEARATEYLAGIGEDLSLYRGAVGAIHPAFFLDQANRALDQNVRLSPWIHVGSTIRHLGVGCVGETLATRGRVRSLYEKKGREYVEVDLLLMAGARPLAHVLHTAIYQLPAPPP